MRVPARSLQIGGLIRFCATIRDVSARGRDGAREFCVSSDIPRWPLCRRGSAGDWREGLSSCPGSPQDPYDRCLLLPILGAEQAFYPWDRAARWEKRVQLEDIRHAPREAYVDNLMKAAKSGNWQQVDGLCGEECRKVLTEMRQT